LLEYQNEVARLNRSQSEKSILGKSYIDEDYNIVINRMSKNQ